MERLYQAVEFEKGYRINNKKPELIVDAHTLLRSIMSIASLIGKYDVFKSIANLEVYSTALLPLIKNGDGCYKVLLPINKHLGKICSQVLNREPKYMTLSVVNYLTIKCSNSSNMIELMKCLKEALNSGVVIQPAKDEEITLLQHKFRRKYVANTLVLTDEVDGFGHEVFKEPVEVVVEEHNVLDRISGGAEPYIVSGVRTFSRFIFVIELPDNVIDDFRVCLKVLKEIGLGGDRSKGWGRFKLRDDTIICDKDLEVLRKISKVTQLHAGKYYVLLGGLSPNVSGLDLYESLYELREVVGYLPTSDVIPQLYVVNAGSLMKLERTIDESKLILRLKTSLDYESLFPITTFALGA